MHKYVKRAITPSNSVTATINDFHLCDTQFFNAQPNFKTNELQYSSCILNMPKRCFKHQFKGLTCNIIVEKLRCHRELNVHVYTEYSIYIFTV